MEVAARLGGGFIASHLVPLSTGVDLTCFELGMYNEAQKHADTSHALGYPLLGMRNKLKRIKP